MSSSDLGWTPRPSLDEDRLEQVTNRVLNWLADNEDVAPLLAPAGVYPEDPDVQALVRLLVRQTIQRWETPRTVEDMFPHVPIRRDPISYAPPPEPTRRAAVRIKWKYWAPRMKVMGFYHRISVTVRRASNARAVWNGTKTALTVEEIERLSD